MQVHGSVNQVCPHSRSLLSKAGSIHRNGSALIHSQINENENASVCEWCCCVRKCCHCWSLMQVGWNNCLPTVSTLSGISFHIKGALFFLTKLQSKTCLTLAFIINLKKKESAPKTNLALNSKSCESLWKRLLVLSSSCRNTNWLRKDTDVTHSAGNVAASLLTCSPATLTCATETALVSFLKSRSHPVVCGCCWLFGVLGWKHWLASKASLSKTQQSI